MAENTDGVNQPVQGDRRLTMRIIVEDLGLNRESVRTTLVQELGMRKESFCQMTRRSTGSMSVETCWRSNSSALPNSLVSH